VQPDNPVVTCCADKAGLSPAFRIVVDVVDHALGQFKLVSNYLGIQVAIEIDPFAAICRPRLAAEGFRDAGGMDGLFKRS
jgi:hypothetical protein